jgi:hypothetical protein
MTKRVSFSDVSSRLMRRASGLLEGLGGDDVVVDRHDLAGDARLEPAQVAVAGEDEEVAVHVATAAVHAQRLALVVVRDATVLVDRGAEFSTAAAARPRQ